MIVIREAPEIIIDIAEVLTMNDSSNEIVQVLQIMVDGFGQINRRLDKIDERLDKMDERLARMEVRQDKMDERLDRMEARQEKMDARLVRVEEHLEHMSIRQDKMADQLTELQCKQGLFELKTKNRFQKLQDGMDTVVQILTMNHLLPVQQPDKSTTPDHVAEADISADWNGESVIE